MLDKIVKFGTLVGLKPADIVEAAELIKIVIINIYKIHDSTQRTFLALQILAFVMRYYFRSTGFLMRVGSVLQYSAAIPNSRLYAIES